MAQACSAHSRLHAFSMSISVAARTIFSDERVTIVSVQSSKCPYRVSFERDGTITLMAPGLEEEVDPASLCEGGSNLPREALAIIAVVLFEEG